jgi:hypothetical protein
MGAMRSVDAGAKSPRDITVAVLYTAMLSDVGDWRRNSLNRSRKAFVQCDHWVSWRGDCVCGWKKGVWPGEDRL